MKRGFIVFMVTLSIVILLSPCTPQAASPTAAPTALEKPQTGGVMKILMTRPATRFGYPPTLTGPDRDYAPPFFNRLIAIGDDGKYQPELALSWNTSADGKTITFKLTRYYDRFFLNRYSIIAIIKDNFYNCSLCWFISLGATIKQICHFVCAHRLFR